MRNFMEEMFNSPLMVSAMLISLSMLLIKSGADLMTALLPVFIALILSAIKFVSILAKGKLSVEASISILAIIWFLHFRLSGRELNDEAFILWNIWLLTVLFLGHLLRKREIDREYLSKIAESLARRKTTSL